VFPQQICGVNYDEENDLLTLDGGVVLKIRDVRE